MRLFYIDKPKCRHIIEITKAVKVIYQMEQEFFPYLMVDFLPNKNDEAGGVIIQAGDTIIRKEWHFEDPNGEEVKELRKILWKLLHEHHDIKDIMPEGSCSPDPKIQQTNKVVQGWATKIKSLDKDVCCKMLKNIVTSEYVRYMSLHPVYRLSNKDVQTRETCKINRMKECYDNYPSNTDQFNRCQTEVHWLCDNGYPNKTVEQSNKVIDEVRQRIFDYLIKNGMKVNKNLFDQIISAGMFDNLGNRMRNKSVNLVDVQVAVDGYLNDSNGYAILFENFSDSPIKKSFNYYYLCLFVVIILFILLIYKSRS